MVECKVVEKTQIVVIIGEAATPIKFHGEVDTVKVVKAREGKARAIEEMIGEVTVVTIVTVTGEGMIGEMVVVIGGETERIVEEIGTGEGNVVYCKLT